MRRMGPPLDDPLLGATMSFKTLSVSSELHADPGKKSWPISMQTDLGRKHICYNTSKLYHGRGRFATDMGALLEAQVFGKYACQGHDPEYPLWDGTILLKTVIGLKLIMRESRKLFLQRFGAKMHPNDLPIRTLLRMKPLCSKL